MFTFFYGCGIPPVTLTCPQQGGGGAQAQTILGPTGTQGCTIPPNCVGPTGWHGCTTPVQCAVLGPTGTQGCTVPPNCVGPTGWHGCGDQGGAQAQANVGVTGWQGCVRTVPPACLGPTAYPGCGGGRTFATVCTQVGCGPTHLIGCTGYQGCHSDQQTGGGAEAQIPTIPVADCIPTRHCTGAWPVC